MATKKKIFKYHVTHSFTDIESNKKVSMATQLYQVGVYGIINNDPALQMSIKPSDMVKIERNLNKQLREGKISDLEFGREIIVEDNGLYNEVK